MTASLTHLLVDMVNFAHPSGSVLVYRSTDTLIL